MAPQRTPPARTCRRSAAPAGKLAGAALASLLARQLRALATSVLGGVGTATDVAFALAQSRTRRPVKKAAVAKGVSLPRGLPPATGLTLVGLGRALEVEDPSFMGVKLMMQTEVGEVYEPCAHGRGSSSTMPHKRNPIASCYIHTAISVVRQHAAALTDAMVADHERSTGPWDIEWFVLPEALCLMAGALRQSRLVLEGLEVDAHAMRRNIDMTHGLVMSEAVMMGLGPYIGREYAHDLVYDICRDTVKQQRPLLDLLAEHPEIRRHLDHAALNPAGLAQCLLRQAHHLPIASIGPPRPGVV